jgi:hypothetical protein
MRDRRGGRSAWSATLRTNHDFSQLRGTKYCGKRRGNIDDFLQSVPRENVPNVDAAMVLQDMHLAVPLKGLPVHSRIRKKGQCH